MRDFDPDAAADLDTLFGLPHTRDEAQVLVMPVPFEGTTSYRQGTAAGPHAVLEASWQVDLCDLETGEPWRAGVHLVPPDPDIAHANTQATQAAAASRAAPETQAAQLRAQVDAAGALVNQRVQAWTAQVLASGKIPAILGGDHAVPLGAMQAAAQTYPGLGVLHVDAHADLREAYEGFTWSHASIFHNVLASTDIQQLVQVGVRDLSTRERARIATDPRVRCWFDTALGTQLAQGTPFATLAQAIVEPLPQDVWISFDIDGLDPSLCPNTGTPVPGGLSWRHTLCLLATLAQSGRRIVGFDLCEVGSQPWDAIVGARLLYKLAGWAIATQPSARSDA